jgi:hypothetical protein
MSPTILVTGSSTDRTNEGAVVNPAKLFELAVAREMIGSLETLTSAGQRHMMAKILSLLRGQVGSCPRVGGYRNRPALSDLEDRLGQEAARLWPDVTGFSRCAESLVGLLTAVAERGPTLASGYLRFTSSRARA